MAGSSIKPLKFSPPTLFSPIFVVPVGAIGVAEAFVIEVRTPLMYSSYVPDRRTVVTCVQSDVDSVCVEAEKPTFPVRIAT